MEEMVVVVLVVVLMVVVGWGRGLVSQPPRNLHAWPHNLHAIGGVKKHRCLSRRNHRQ